MASPCAQRTRSSTGTYSSIVCAQAMLLGPQPMQGVPPKRLKLAASNQESRPDRRDGRPAAPDRDPIRAGFLNIKFHKESRVDPQRLMSLVSGTPGTQFSPAGVLHIPVDARFSAAELLEFLRSRLLELFPEPVEVRTPPG